MSNTLINLNPINRSNRGGWIINYNDNNIYDINSKSNYYLPYKDIFNSKIFKNDNQIIVCYFKLKSIILTAIQQSNYRWLSYCYRSYPQMLNYIKYNYGSQVFYMKNFVNDYFIIDNGYIGVVNNTSERNGDNTINVRPLMCLCLKSNNLVEFAKNKQSSIIDKKHFVLLIDHSFSTNYPLVYKKIDKEYIQNFKNQGYDILYTNVEDKIYNNDRIIKNNFKNIDELFSYLNSLNDELKQM